MKRLILALLLAAAAITTTTTTTNAQTEMNKHYRITYRIPSSPSMGQQHMTIEAPNATTAERLFKASFPQFQLCSMPTEIR